MNRLTIEKRAQIIPVRSCSWRRPGYPLPNLRATILGKAQKLESPAPFRRIRPNHFTPWLNPLPEIERKP